MRALKRAVDIFLVCVLFPIAVLFIVSIVIAVNAVAFAAYLGTLLAIWLLFAYVLPLSVGMITPDEVLTRVRSLRREGTHYEGEPLPRARSLRRKRSKFEVEPFARVRSLRRERRTFEGESLPSDIALWMMRWDRGETELAP